MFDSRDVKLILKGPGGYEQWFLIDIDPRAPIADSRLKDDVIESLINVLGLALDPRRYELKMHSTSTLRHPVLLLSMVASART